ETLILGGNMPICDYNKGSSVIGLTGLTEVVRTFSRSYKGDLVSIRPNGMLPIIITPEHPVFATFGHASIRRLKRTSHNEIVFSQANWVRAKSLIPKKSNTDGNYVIVPIINGSFDRNEVSLLSFIKKRKPRHKGYRESYPLDEDSAWLIGFFVAEGSVTREVRFSLSKFEEDIRDNVERIAKRLGYSARTQYLENENSILVSISSRVLARALDSWCGHRAFNKMIPDFILMHSDNKILKAFLKGYEAGDSYQNVNKSRGNKSYRICSTVSLTLAEQLQLAYIRLGIWASVFLVKSAGKESIMGRECSVHARYVVSYPLKPNQKRQKVKFDGEGVFCPVREIKKIPYEGKVYNLETKDNSYLISNAIVHNCGKWFTSKFELDLHTKLHYIL
ncbi:MAG TPA: LAGLIDADG family homing endonuclease, partial [Nitrososphaerales archaeon]|nr:LAGLIDADG family homing endonuclease [Nitrososphaerales archaeon]